jgi:signal transduction histidine kinase
MSAAAVATSYSHLPSVRAFLLTAGTPLTIGFLLHGGTLYLAMGIMCACFLVFLMIHARLSNGVLVDSFRLKEEKAALVEDLSDARDSLEARVRERTSELENMNLALQEEMRAHAETERRLQQAHKMEAVGQLTGGVAHDFNNLLAVIQGNAELLGEERGENDRLVGSILRASKRGAELTQRLLAFSRQQPLQPRSIDLADLVNGMADLLKRSLGETVEIETFAGRNLWMARADPGQVENALLNLAINARDAMPDGGRLTIACSNARLEEEDVRLNPEAAAGDYALLTVSDTGAGMPKVVLEHAFEPFFTTKDVGEGSGLGLSMVYGFARQSNGHAVLQSEPGKGTTVKLYLPRAEPVVEKPTAEITAPEPGSRDKLVLVIEDDAEVRTLAVKMLEVLGYRSMAAPAARSARVILEREKIDLVLSDVVLPGGQSGRSFADEMRQRHPRLKFVFMSGYPAEDAIRSGHLEPETVLLTKPFQMRQLARVLRDLLDG